MFPAATSHTTHTCEVGREVASMHAPPTPYGLCNETCMCTRTHSDCQLSSTILTAAGFTSSSNVTGLGCEIRSVYEEKRTRHISSSVILLLSNLKLTLCNVTDCQPRWNALFRLYRPLSPVYLLCLSFPLFRLCQLYHWWLPHGSGAPVTSRRWSARPRDVPPPPSP